jgi:hypothetical protein
MVIVIYGFAVGTDTFGLAVLDVEAEVGPLPRWYVMARTVAQEDPRK